MRIRFALALTSALAPAAAMAGGVQAPVGPQPFTATGTTAPRSSADRAADVINVKDFGAKGDGVQITSGVTVASGAPTALTVAGASFTAADVGKTIFVGGIGTGGAELATTIAAVSGPTQITLATAASTFVSGSSQTVTYGTDDATAINAAFTAVRAAQSTSAGLAARIQFPRGIYVVKSSGINATTLTGLAIQGAGATLYGATSGSAVLDLLMDYAVEVDGLAIIGDSALVPSTGIQMGRIASGQQATGRNVFRRVTTYGQFSVTPAYDLGSETTFFDGCNFNTKTPGTYAFIDDGVNHFGLTSQFLTITLPANTAFTNTNSSAYASKFVASGAGSSAFWVAGAGTLRIDAGYFYAPSYGVVFYQTGGSRNVAVDISGTIEGITDNFFLAGDAAQALTQFTYHSSATNATDAVFKTDTNVTSVNCYACQVQTPALQGSAVGFTAPSIWTYDGSIYSQASTNWTLPSTFQGFTDFGTTRTYYGSALTAGSGATISSGGALAVGASANASGSGSMAIGPGSHAGGTGSLVGGNNGFSVRYANLCWSSGYFISNGDAQTCWQQLRVVSTSTSSVRLTANAASATGTTVVNVEPTFNGAYLVELRMVGRDTNTGDVAFWTTGPFIMKVGANASTTALVGSPTFTAGANTGGGCLAGIAAPTVTADTTNGGLNVSVTPMNSDTCHWVASAWTPVEIQ